MSCLFILEINPLSVASFANIFSHSVGCLKCTGNFFHSRNCLILQRILVGISACSVVGRSKERTWDAFCRKTQKSVFPGIQKSNRSGGSLALLNCYCLLQFSSIFSWRKSVGVWFLVCLETWNIQLAGVMCVGGLQLVLWEHCAVGTIQALFPDPIYFCSEWKS